MSSEKKTFRVTCAECGKAFTVRFTVVDDAAEGTGRETVICQHCGEQVIIPVKKKYQSPDELIRLTRWPK